MPHAEPAPEHLLRECSRIEGNCLYTAQAFFSRAEKAEKLSRLLLIVPSLLSAITGILAAVGLPSWLGAFAALGGVVTGIASALGVDRIAGEHRQVANRLTALRHEAISIREALWREISREQLVAEVRRLNDRYNWLIQGPLATDRESFTAARKLIKSGVFDPDE